MFKKQQLFDFEVHALFDNKQSNFFSPPSSQYDFRYKPLTYEFLDDHQDNWVYTGVASIDRLKIKYFFDNSDMTFGRQAISWGSGRIWRPTDVFLAFSPLDLIRDYKPGIDLVRYTYYPNDFDSIDFVYHPSSNNEHSAAIFYSKTIGNVFLSFIYANLLSSHVLGGNWEADINNFTFHFEASLIQDSEANESTVFAVTGVDYQFSNEWLMSLELYFNKAGYEYPVSNERISNNTFFQKGFTPQLARFLSGLSLSKPLNPLLNFQYVWLSAIQTQSTIIHSTLHQFSLNYSTSNESELRVTSVISTGEEMKTPNSFSSEFGHIPNSITLRYSYYF